MRKPNTITRVCIRRYTDNGQVTAYVFWSNGSRTEGEPPQGDAILGYRSSCGYMEALFASAIRQGLTIERETW